MRQRRLRILFNTPNPRLHGGPPTHLHLLEKELHKHVHVERFDYGRQTDSETILDKILGRSKHLIALRAKIRVFQPDIIHHNTAFDCMSILRDAPLVWLAKKNNIPILLKVHGSLKESFGTMNPVLHRLRSSILNSAVCIGVLSDVEKENFVKTWSFLNERVKVVKNIIPPDFYEVKRQEAERPSLLFISRFIREKGIFDLLEAVPGVIHALPSALFTFVGSGGDAGEFDRRVVAKKLTPYVSRIGHINNLETAKLYARAWALVFPTRFPEGMPMVVAEAMAAGVPIITTKTRFSISYMDEERHCIYVGRENPIAMGEKINYLLERAHLRNEMSQNNRDLAKAFRADRVTEEFLDIYGRMVKECAV